MILNGGTDSETLHRPGNCCSLKQLDASSVTGETVIGAATDWDPGISVMAGLVVGFSER
jgi:hypothetical protein